MDAEARERYLATAILTAPPQKLQLLLLEAALRAGERAAAYWQQGDDPQAWSWLLKAQEIAGQLLGGLNHEVNPALSRKVAAVYAYIYRTLVEAASEHSVAKLADAIRVLSVERETWQQVCQQLAEAAAPPPVAPAEVPAPHFAPESDAGAPSLAPSAGLSLEA